MQKTYLIVGASGVNGRAVTDHLVGKDARVITLSRDDTPIRAETPHVRADLLDPDTLTGLEEVTHVFYAALKPEEDAATEARENRQMLENLLDALKQQSRLEHVVFLQGGKVYGAHLGVYKTPAREDDSRHFPPNLYFDQEDLIRQRAKEDGFEWTALRPDILIAPSLGSEMNLGNLIGVYGALCKEMGVAMQFPGTAAAYDVLVNVSDGDIVAQATDWAFETKNAGAFNITNGDVFRWRHVWPRIATFFELETGEPQPISLAERISAAQPTWDRMVQKYDLAVQDLESLAKGAFGDFIFHVETDAIFDVTKARAAGFDKMTHRSDDSILKHLETMREKRWIP